MDPLHQQMTINLVRDSFGGDFFWLQGRVPPASGKSTARRSGDDVSCAEVAGSAEAAAAHPRSRPAGSNEG